MRTEDLEVGTGSPGEREIAVNTYRTGTVSEAAQQ